MLSSLTPSHSPVDSDHEQESHSPETEKAMMRARERARAFETPSDGAKTLSVLPAAPRPLPRNKSNEQVKSSLKARPGLVRANSEPSQKCVHFSSTNLEDVRPFKRCQSPSAVSRKSSIHLGATRIRLGNGDSFGEDLDCTDVDDDEEDEDDMEEYSSSEDEDDHVAARSVKPRRSRRSKQNKKDPAHSWTLLTPGFSPHVMGRLGGAHRPNVYLDNVQLTTDQKSLKAIVYVQNLGFEKYVALRYSLNCWESFGESQGKWSPDIRKFDRDAGYDRFDVTVPLDHFAGELLNSRTLQACVRYIVNGKDEFWDNNNSKNYDFYLRNSMLPSSPMDVPSKTFAKGPNAKGSATQNPAVNPSGITTASAAPVSSKSAPRLGPRSYSVSAIPTNSIGRLDLDDSGRDTEDEDTSETEDPLDMSAARILKRAGVRIRQQSEESKKSDPFFGRYSFAASFNASPKKVMPSQATNNYLSATQRRGPTSNTVTRIGLQLGNHRNDFDVTSNTPPATLKTTPINIPNFNNDTTNNGSTASVSGSTRPGPYALTNSSGRTPVKGRGRASAEPQDYFSAGMEESSASRWRQPQFSIGVPETVPSSDENTPTDSPTEHAWESESYKDFISRYCFFTPAGKSEKAEDENHSDSSTSISSTSSDESASLSTSTADPMKPLSLHSL